MESPFLTVEELAELMRLPVASVRKYASSNPERLPPRFPTFGRRIIWHKDDVIAWIEKGRKLSRASPRGMRLSADNMCSIKHPATYARSLLQAQARVDAAKA